MLKAVIFDLDNTLTDFMRMKERAVEGAAQAMVDAGLPKSRDEVIERIKSVYDREGMEYQKVFDDFIEDELGYVDPKILAAGIVGYRKGREGALELYPHVNMTLFELMKRGLKLAVLSDAPQMSAWLRLAYLKLHNVFDVVVTHDDTGRHKPAPEPFEMVLKKLDIEPSRAIMVGDWPERDIKGARELGMKTVYARYGNVNAAASHSPDFTINDIHELVGIVDYLNDQEELFEK
ncbi:MAG: HAD-IA family hydrolase [bacterium]|nr:HAD-IA family hydrolase [bacterium]